MRKRPLCLFSLVFLVVQMIVIGGFHLHRDWNPSLLEKTVKEESVITLSGKVYHTEEKKDYRVIYLMSQSYQTRILVYLRQETSMQMKLNSVPICIGNEIQVTGEVAYFESPRNPGEFDQKFYYQKQGIHGTVWASEYVITSTKRAVWKETLARIRVKWKTMLVQALGETNGNIMSAILLGDKSELDQDLKELYQKSGIGHILAISGLHMTFIGLGFYQFLRRRGLSFISAGIIGIVFLVSYSMMIGNGVASVRALVMFILRIGADMTGRVYDMLTALAVAAIVILIWRPLYLYDAGFLLSFGAILGILIVNPLIAKCADAEEKEKKILRSVKEKIKIAICGSVSINLAILPCMLYFYYEVPAYSVIVNLLVIPLMSVVLGVGVIGSIICGAIPFVGGVILHLCLPVLKLYEGMCQFCMNLPGNRIVSGQPQIYQIVIYYVLLSIALLILWKNDRKVVSYCLIFLASALLFLKMNILFGAKDSVSVTMLDVGQGDGFVVRTFHGETYLIDGGSSNVSNVGKYRIEPYLKSQGIDVLDYVFISHGDMDHYSGVEEMIQRQKVGIKIKVLVLPDEKVVDEKLKKLAKLAKENGIKVAVIHSKETIENKMAGLFITCIQPDSNYNGEIGNASSMVLSLSYRKFDMLFTGDVEGEGETLLEEAIAKQEKNMQYEVLKVAHHGSKNSSSQSLLDEIHPRIALISAGQKNRYGHPHQETIQKLKKLHCQIENTQTSGAVMIISDGKTIKVRTFIP